MIQQASVYVFLYVCAHNVGFEALHKLVYCVADLIHSRNPQVLLSGADQQSFLMWKLEHKWSGFSSEFVGFNQNTRVSHIFLSYKADTNTFWEMDTQQILIPKLKDWFHSYLWIHQDGGSEAPSASVYYTECKPKIKKGGLGTRATSFQCRPGVL